MGFILFSYISTTGKGGNPYVARVATSLRNQGHTVEMRHTENVGQEQRGHSTTINFQEWMIYWKKQADKADLIVLFDNKKDKNIHGETYKKSDACQAEFGYAQKLHHLRVGRYQDEEETSSYVAQKVHDKLESQQRRGGRRDPWALLSHR